MEQFFILYREKFNKSNFLFHIYCISGEIGYNLLNWQKYAIF